MKVIHHTAFSVLLDSLRASRYRLIGSTLRDQAIVYDDIRGMSDLPIGWTDDQRPGHYRLRRRADEAFFGYVVGPNSWKRWLFPPRERLISLRISGSPTESEPQPLPTIVPEPIPHERLAFIGVRPCELRAIEIQDRVFLKGPYVDQRYRARREQVFIIAVNCNEPATTCFCTSQRSGPRAVHGFDLALTELIDGSQHDFLVEADSDRGEELLDDLPGRAATPADRALATQLAERAASRISRRLDNDHIRDVLYRNLDHSAWEAVADRCLACANCTQVCPTCFCSTIDDTTSLDGAAAERWRQWDSCFNADFSYIVGGPIRGSVRARYRQWLTHKLAGWHDQFGESGCVGCGRCITWCPVGIDITEEAARIRAADGLTARGAAAVEAVPCTTPVSP